MSTITKERAELKAFITGFLSDPMHDDKSSNSLTAEVFRIALASLEAEPVISHVGSKNALDDIVAFIKSNRNPTLKDHNQVSERLFQDNCHGISNHVIEYIKRIGEELEELRSAQDSAPPAPESVTDYPETLPCPVMLEPGLRFGKGVPTRTMLGALQRRAEYYAEIEAMTPEQRAEHDAGMKEFAAMLQGAKPVTTAYKLPANTPCKDAPEHIWLQTSGVWPESVEFSELTWCSDNQHEDDTLYVRADVVSGNSPVIPDGWALVPVEPTEHMIVEGFESEPDEFFSDEEVWNAYDAMSGCQQAAHRAKLCWAAMIASAPKPEA
ncbi:hypothetical protein ACYCII_16630 [Enterobacter roggenkampii]|uniref:hypothetical protein n=1 Tax=Enterobacter roggenkampii TaxID=1812935 RepID=UPI003D701A3E